MMGFTERELKELMTKQEYSRRKARRTIANYEGEL